MITLSECVDAAWNSSAPHKAGAQPLIAKGFHGNSSAYILTAASQGWIWFLVNQMMDALCPAVQAVEKVNSNCTAEFGPHGQN